MSCCDADGVETSFRIVLEDRHVPARGRYHNVLVEDSANGLFYLYDCAGAYVEIPVNVQRVQPPVNGGSTGRAGQIAWDSNYIYVCIATNTWKRTAVSSW